jgi:hypothetical protein
VLAKVEDGIAELILNRWAAAAGTRDLLRRQLQCKSRPT